MKTKITNEQVHRAYEVACQVYERKISRKDATDDLVKNFKMNEVTAANHIYNLQKMLEGERYERTMNPYATEHFIQNILKDYGLRYKSLALNALEQHLDYYASLKNGGPQHKHRRILEKYQETTSL